VTGNEYWLVQYLSEFTYLGMFVILFIGGFGFPFPEEVVLVLAGYGIYAEVTKPWLTIIACLTGALAGDQVMYWIGRWWVAVPMR
jgi:membrane protein DedA with SNARE-associated domain